MNLRRKEIRKRRRIRNSAEFDVGSSVSDFEPGTEFAAFARFDAGVVSVANVEFVAGSSVSDFETGAVLAAHIEIGDSFALDFEEGVEFAAGSFSSSRWTSR